MSATQQPDSYIAEADYLAAEQPAESTLRKDYPEKAMSYQSIPSLQSYLIVAQDKH